MEYIKNSPRIKNKYKMLFSVANDKILVLEMETRERIKMKAVELITKDELFKKVNIKHGQLCCYLNEENDIHINGSLTLEGKWSEDCVAMIKANLCDKEGNILYIVREFSCVNFKILEYVTFSIYCANITRFFDVQKLHHVELYPYINSVKNDYM